MQGDSEVGKNKMSVRMRESKGCMWHALKVCTTTIAVECGICLLWLDASDSHYPPGLHLLWNG